MYTGKRTNRKDLTFPRLMQDGQGNVYLMRAPNAGMLVYKAPEAIMRTGLVCIGDYSSTLTGDGLVPFRGEIILGETQEYKSTTFLASGELYEEK